MANKKINDPYEFPKNIDLKDFIEDSKNSSINVIEFQVFIFFCNFLLLFKTQYELFAVITHSGT